MPTATHGGIGRTLSLNASSLPFKVMLTLLNLCVMLRDSHDCDNIAFFLPFPFYSDDLRSPRSLRSLFRPPSDPSDSFPHSP